MVIISTSGDDWASYYHIVGVPVAALIMGLTIGFIIRQFKKNNAVIYSLFYSLDIGLSLLAAKAFLHFKYLRYRIIFVGILLTSAIGLLFPVISNITSKRRLVPEFNFLVSSFLFFSMLSVFPFQSFQIGKDLHPVFDKELFECALILRPLIPEGSLIIAFGGKSKDETRRPVAYNASYMFFWLDRKGFNIPSDNQTINLLMNFSDLGAEYFVYEKRYLPETHRFFERVLNEFTLVKECESANLFVLKSSD